MDKKRLQSLRNKRLREYDVAHGLLIRKYAINLVSDMILMSNDLEIKKYGNFINIIQALQCGPMSRAGNGIILELALKKFLINLCPKKLLNREKSVIRVDEIVCHSDSAVYDLLIDLSIWNQDNNLRQLAISMLMATNRFLDYNCAERAYDLILTSKLPFFPIQVKKNNDKNSDLMTDKSINIYEIDNVSKFDTIKQKTAILLQKHFQSSREKLGISYIIPGLFFNNFFIEKENYSILEIMPMPTERDFEENFDILYDFSYLEDGNILKLIPTRQCKTDIGFIINKNKCRYHISNRREKNQQFELKINQKIEKDSISESDFVLSAIAGLENQLILKNGKD